MQAKSHWGLTGQTGQPNPMCVACNASTPTPGFVTTRVHPKQNPDFITQPMDHSRPLPSISLAHHREAAEKSGMCIEQENSISEKERFTHSSSPCNNHHPPVHSYPHWCTLGIPPCRIAVVTAKCPGKGILVIIPVTIYVPIVFVCRHGVTAEIIPEFITPLPALG